ncbi:MAG: ParB/RepB/Spo0J family partition protein [Cyanobacteria bacterium SIG29]|nr:ParB/RepB/Spo0J family partition protein [Cyanobacteria bacterium SIG29]
MAAKSKGGLGKGLGALINNYEEIIEQENLDRENIFQLKLEDIYPNPNQPRKHFDEDDLADLTESIREHGVFQPILVIKQEQGHMIIAGERRWRAAKLAGLTTIPAIIKNLTEQEVYELALIENIQRIDLNVVEEAQAYAWLQNHFGYSHEQIAKRVGKSRTTITNILRLLALPKEILEMLAENKLTIGHVRPLLTLEDKEMQIDLAYEIYQARLSVREVEKMINDLKATPKEKNADNEEKELPLSVDLKNLQEQLMLRLGTKVNIKHKQKKGKLEIEFYGEEDLKRIIDALGGEFY